MKPPGHYCPYPDYLHKTRNMIRNKQRGTGFQIESMPLQCLTPGFDLFVAGKSQIASFWVGQHRSEYCQNELHHQSQAVLPSWLLEWIQAFLSTMAGTQQRVKVHCAIILWEQQCVVSPFLCFTCLLFFLFCILCSLVGYTLEYFLDGNCRSELSHGTTPQ